MTKAIKMRHFLELNWSHCFKCVRIVFWELTIWNNYRVSFSYNYLVWVMALICLLIKVSEEWALLILFNAILCYRKSYQPFSNYRSNYRYRFKTTPFSHFTRNGTSAISIHKKAAKNTQAKLLKKFTHDDTL